MFSLRIVTVDHYMSSPKSGLDLTYSQFRGSQIRSVPVFRIFGSTPSGNKTCLHVHGVFPYILVPYSGDEDAGRLMYQLASSLDKAINVSQNSSHSSRQHVFKIVQVSGRPFYGYHTQDHQFFKIFFYNPLVVKRACDLLQNGAVCGTKFQIHEGHVPFTLQFFIDYNLYGMSFINLKSVVYRKDACPSGVVAGSLPKESCCELEADAVAVDILNRLTIEGELAVNPGLNAIWQEEKKRLKRDALEVSQRPEPPLVMSEILLREKLKDNLRFLGKCKTPLKENIPYPAETQRTLGSDILDASVLDTHSISSLFPARSNSEEEKAIVDEELVLSLTQNSMLSNSLDQSVLMALDDLAAQNEVTTAMSQQVEEDSILGSQMFLEQNMVGDDISDEELEALNLSFPQDIPSDNCSGSDSDEETGENFEENIPQLDGIGDFVKNNKSKRSKRKRKVLVENSATEVYPPSDAEEILLNDLKDNNCWPESGKQETLEEIFSDEEPYNSPINNFENSCESVNLDPINVDLINNSFETVLRGDPSFTTRDLASEDVIFQPVDDEVEVDNENKTSLSEEQSFQDNVNLCVKKYFADKTSDLDVVPSLNNSLSIVDHEKSDMLAISSEELLNTSQLDEILNEDLNKGLEIICEKSPQQEFEENWVRCGDTSKPFEAKEEDNLMTDEVFTTNDLYLCCNIEGSETILSEEDLKYNDPSKDTIFEEVDIKPLCENMYVNENHPPTIFTEEEQNNSPNKNKMYKIDCRSPKKSPNSKLCVKIFKKEKKKKKTDLKFYNSFDMTRKEIETYCSQVGTLRSLSILPNVDIPQPMLWFPIREIMGTKPSKEKRKSKPKLSAIEKIMKKCKFSDKEISKMKNCKVRVIKLMDNEILEYLRHPVSHEGKSNNRKTTLDRSNSKQNNLKHAIIQHTSKHSESLSPFVSNVESEISLSDITIKQENCQEQSSADNYMRSPCSKEYPQTQSCEKSSPQKLSAKASLFQPQWKSCKLNNDCKEENECCQNNPLMLSVKVPLVQLKNIIPDSVHIQQSFVDKNIKKENDFKKLQGKDLQQKENKSKTKPLNFLKNKKNFNDLQKIDGVVTMDVNISCAKEASFVQNQRSSIKLDKECIVKVLPLSVDVISNKTQNSEHEVSQRTKQDGDSISETLNIVTNLNPLVKVEKLTTPFNSSDSIVPPDVEVQGVFKSKKQCSSYKNGLKSQNEKSSEKRKRSLRMYSLDGTVDSSSSDENLDEKLNTNKDSENLYCTPNKRRKPKTCRSPRNYAPLSIEIKKSPKTKLITKTEELVESIDAKRYQDEQNIVSAETDRMVISQGDSVESNRHEINQPTNILASVEKLEKCFFDKNDPIESCQPTTSTTSQPLVKRLKVCVKRMSLDIPGYSLGHKEVAKIRGRLHRSSSLPGMTEEKICPGKKDVLGVSEFCDLTERLEDEGTEGGSSIKDKRVRKALMFPEPKNKFISDASTTEIAQTVRDRKPLPERKISTDLFESNSTPESLPKPSHRDNLPGPSHSDNSSSSIIRLSGVAKSNTPDFGDTTWIASPLNNTQLSIDISECEPVCTNISRINRNPHDIKDPILFTPAFEPPSRTEVFSKLREFGLAEVVSEEPFYSEPGDVSKACEVGSTVLKLQSKSVTHLEEFEGTFNYLSKWKRESLGENYSEEYNSRLEKLISSRIVTITPLKPPPTRQQAQEWLKSKIATKHKEVAESKKLIKIVLPSSPASLACEKDDDSIDDSMTISQCTPLSKVSVEDSDIESVEVQSQNTPEVVSNKGSDISPLMASTPVNFPSKKLILKRKFSRPSSGLRMSLPLIKEETQNNLQEDVKDRQDGSNSQTVLASESTKLLSDSGVKRLLSESKSPASSSCQIDMATPNNSGNYRMELENLQDVKLVQEHQFLTILNMELHVHTRGELRPNPEHDAICCIFYNITNDYPEPIRSNITGVLYVSSDGKEEKMPQFACELHAVADEPSLIAEFLALIRLWNPDIFVGYEIELLSWGYLLQRAYVLNMNLVAELSRVVRPLEGREGEGREEVGDDDSEIRLAGRIVLNLWRFLRHEVALQSYTFENIMYHVMHQRVPLFSFRTLTSWWAHRTKLYRWLVFEHYFTRVEGMAKIMRHVDLVGRTSEFARLFGIQFYEVLSRGSQFRVESMMLRLVKPLNYVAVSPSVQQRAKMRAPESLPLIMEPQSRFYTDPVIVLDFQSLYPSIIIAYNYCFSTCLGRVEHLGRSELFEFGCTQLRVPVRELLRLKGSLNFSPCGVAFVNQSVVRGVLPRMLEEILNTRLMVKQSMKENKGNKTLQRVLHNRQLGLKLIANVTYGYTAANFSGRMPCIEVGDSVVSKARETLERAISLVSNNTQWGAKVVYGDTDSMFVLVPGRSRREAFRIGAEIAEAVTNDNPQPVKLKLEKVYQPCLLQTKKRYVGYMYESPSQEDPVYDAKGIETVRRDGCPAVAKVLEKSLRLLFETRDMSLVKRYVCRQFGKVLSGRISIQDLTFAREYRGAAGYKPGACVPALELAKQGRAVDPRSEPRVGERVPYVVVAGAPGLPLIRLVRPPTALLHDPGLRVNAEYYITRVIAPPLHRCLSLLGANVMAWYSELPRKQHMYLPNMGEPQAGARKATISQYFATCDCIACGQVTTRGVCDQCQTQPQRLSVTLSSHVLDWERRVALVAKICQSCCGRTYEMDCTSLDCPVLYRLCQARRDLRQADYVRGLQLEFLGY